MRQACADGKTAEAMKIHEEFLDTYREGEAILWISYNLLRQTEQARAVLVPYDDANQVYALSSYLNYPYFDPTPYPKLMEVLENQGVERPPPIRIPLSCNLTSQTT